MLMHLEQSNDERVEVFAERCFHFLAGGVSSTASLAAASASGLTTSFVSSDFTSFSV